MPEEIGNTVKMFAGHTKVYAKKQDEKDCQSLQEDLNRLGAWSRKWSLRFNETKCIFLRIRECIKYAYTLNGHKLEVEPHQKDLGVYISDTLKQGWGQIRICICKYKYKYKYGVFVFVFVFDQI